MNSQAGTAFADCGKHRKKWEESGTPFMKKVGAVLIIVGIILYALAALLGVTVRDDEGVRALSRSTGIVTEWSPPIMVKRTPSLTNAST